MNKKYYPWIPIVGIWLTTKHNSLSELSSVSCDLSAIVQGLSVVAVIIGVILLLL